MRNKLRLAATGLVGLAVFAISGFGQGPDPADQYYTSIRSNDMAMVNAMVFSRGVKFKDKYGSTPLHYAAAGSEPKACPVCRGTGRQRFSQGFLTVARPCGNCRGEGRVIEKPCSDCRGEGRTRKSRNLQIRVPAGVESGSRLRLGGEGDAGPNGGPHGDLYVHLTVADHDVFTREGDDVVLTADIPFPTLVLGGEIGVPTVDSDELEPVTIAPGTRVGSEMRLRGKGFGRLGRRGGGDLVVRAGLRVPESPSSEEKDLLRRYAELTGAPVSGKGVFEKAKKIFQ